MAMIKIRVASPLKTQRSALVVAAAVWLGTLLVAGQSGGVGSTEILSPVTIDPLEVPGDATTVQASFVGNYSSFGVNDSEVYGALRRAPGGSARCAPYQLAPASGPIVVLAEAPNFCTLVQLARAAALSGAAAIISTTVLTVSNATEAATVVSYALTFPELASIVAVQVSPTVGPALRQYNSVHIYPTASPSAGEDGHLRFLGLVKVTMTVIYSTSAVLLVLAVGLVSLRWYRRRKRREDGRLSPSPPELPRADEMLASIPTHLYSSPRRQWSRPWSWQSGNDASHIAADQCCICISNVKSGETIRELPCNHQFHSACIGQWLRRSRECPLCKADVYDMILGEDAGSNEVTLPPASLTARPPGLAAVVVSPAFAVPQHNAMDVDVDRSGEYIELDVLPSASVDRDAYVASDLSC